MNGCSKVMWTAAIAALAGLSGCQNSVNTVENAEKNQNMTAIKDARFQTDSFLATRLKVASVNAAVNAGGLMEAQVAAFNDRTGFWSEMWSGITGENPYPVSYRFVWMDENGIAVDSPMSGWQRIQILPGQMTYFRSVAPTRQCRDFVLNVRETD